MQYFSIPPSKPWLVDLKIVRKEIGSLPPIRLTHLDASITHTDSHARIATCNVRELDSIVVINPFAAKKIKHTLPWVGKVRFQESEEIYSSRLRTWSIEWRVK